MTWHKHSQYFSLFDYLKYYSPEVLKLGQTRGRHCFSGQGPLGWERDGVGGPSSIFCCILNWVYNSVWRAYSAMNKQESSSCSKAYSYTEDSLLKTQGPEHVRPFFFRLAYGRLFKHHLNLNWLLILHSINIRGATIILLLVLKLTLFLASSASLNL